MQRGSASTLHGPEVFGGSRLIIILSQGKVNIFNLAKNAGTSVEQIVQSLGRRNGAHR